MAKFKDCLSQAGMGGVMGFMVGGGMAGGGGLFYSLSPSLRGQRRYWVMMNVPKLILKGGGGFACFLGFAALIRCL
ncbi:reactive oxygen species modulator [Acrasis kona]|uniref:Reactive oxygen species modulator n=1 Tax=Acrasis kona TaxID=1008807 RepID=A0AAW2YGE2_9EUKA